MIKTLIVLTQFFYYCSSFAAADWLKPVELRELQSKKRVSIVFASQNLRSPVSMFGHTFLVFHDEVIPEADAVALEFLGLTDKVYCAHTKALLSHIQGEFRLTRYLLKKNQYESEDRSLWVYELNLPKLEIERIKTQIAVQLNHQFEYTFVRKNCSYYIFNLVLAPETHKHGFPVYTLPRRTLRRLEELGYLKRQPLHAESTQLKLTNYFSELTGCEEKAAKRIVAGEYLSDQDASPRAIRAATLALTYKIPREPDPKTREQYYNTKKRLITRLKRSTLWPIASLEEDPAHSYGDTSLRFGLSTDRPAFILEGKLAQRDFYTSGNDGLSTSYLEVIKGKFKIDQDRLSIEQFTIFKMENMTPGNDFREPFNRLLDLSYYKRIYQENRSLNEYVVRYGFGLSRRASQSTIGLMPYFGLRLFDLRDRLRGEVDLGVLLRLNFWLNNRISVEGSLYKYLATRMPVTYQIEFKLSAKLSPRWTLGLENTSSNGANVSEIALVYGF